MKIIFTIITTSIVHNDNCNYIAPASLFDLPSLEEASISPEISLHRVSMSLNCARYICRPLFLFEPHNCNVKRNVMPPKFDLSIELEIEVDRSGSKALASGASRDMAVVTWYT